LNTLEAKAIGCLAGAAVGDALGSPTEGYAPAEIRQRYGGWVDGIVPPFDTEPPTRPSIARFHKGNGRFTDDTLMTLALVAVYERKRRHLNAYDVADELVPILLHEPRWIPDLERDDILLQRVLLAGWWLVLRHHFGHADPREGGVGNMVDCGAAMYAAPVGIINAGSPESAYAEAIDIASAHQWSYGREAAGVQAAAVAAAMAPNATINDVIETCLRVAHDGTRMAIEAVCARARQVSDWKDALEALRDAMAPFDTVGPDFRDPGHGARRPSRLHAIEELPVALGLLIIAGGSCREAVLGAVNYGRDADSIATMAGAVAGALNGIDGVPADWVADVEREGRLDLAGSGIAMARLAVEIAANDDRLLASHRSDLAELSGGEYNPPSRSA
jgi:ADP-ribosylglycohydrolase